MCGIIGYTGEKEPKETLLQALKRLEYRGYDSAGIATLEEGDFRVYRCEGRLEGLEAKLKDENLHSTIGIGHTRWATHGAPIERNAHPHRVGSVVLVHNGIVENFAHHKAKLEAAGRKIQSDTDSEIVAHLIDQKIEEGVALVKAVQLVLPTLEGSYAFVIMSTSAPDTIVAARNGSPLLIGIGEKEIYCASDVQAILSWTNKVVYLEDKQMAVCTPNHYEVFDAAGLTVKTEVKQINWTADELGKVGYAHFMLKEIHEQPRALTNTIEGNINHSDEIISIKDLGIFRKNLKAINRVSIVACGTSLHAALLGKYYIEQFSRLPVEVDFASEFRYRNPILEKDNLCIFISQSGETLDTLAAMREAKSRAVPCLAICNVRDSTLAREADVTIYTNAGPEIGVASTKAFTAQTAVLYMLAVEMGHIHASLFKTQYQSLTRDIVRTPVLMEKVLGLEDSIKKAAAEYQNFRCFFYVGRGIYYPIALEGALKLKEITYLHAEGYPAGELKHGPIALIGEDVVTFVLAPQASSNPPNNPTTSRVYYEKLMANLEEVKARDGKIIAVGTENDTRLAERADVFWALPSASWAINPLLLSIPVQLFAYHVALNLGTDVDKPRNLAKSVTVE
ncbi:MAG: glutamine--fructose-6-phosphate transaminase (isomerizing) [Bdellovibrionota bacterium]